MVYVVANMTTTPDLTVEYSVTTALVASIFFTVFVAILGDGLVNDKGVE